MQEIRTSKNGIEYIHKILSQKKLIFTQASLYKIPHNRTKNDEVAVKIGKYKKRKEIQDLTSDELENSTPKSELTLKGEEFHALIEFIESHFEPFEKGIKKYIPLDNQFSKENLTYLQTFFNHPKKQELVHFFLQNNIIPEELLLALNQISKKRAVNEFEKMLENDLTEHDWQKWFNQNSWVLGTEYVRILDERRIDLDHVSDFLMKTYDGFIDIVEIKRPTEDLNFWAKSKDHKNYVPSQDLVRAISQVSRYLYEIERESNSLKFLQQVGGVKTIKPRCVLIFGRSNDWDEEKKESFRILNSNFSHLSILTYDHVLERAKRMLA